MFDALVAAAATRPRGGRLTVCGFGLEVRPGGRADRSALERMGAALAPRGPDGDGLWLDGDAGLVHRRLAIIDLSERGAQPMRDEALGLAVAFNGCIYNHRELRRELEQHGHTFASTSDTEVILKAWAQWGEGMLDRFAGMFAFCLREDGGPRRARARPARASSRCTSRTCPTAGCGPRPRSRRWCAAGGVDTRVDPVALHHYLSWHSIVPAPRTILRGVGKLPPATVLVVEPDGTRRERRYWDPPFARDPERADWSEADWTDAVREALRVAVRRRMVADVPVGILLSGGLDSSLIVALLAEQGQHGLATFSIGFPDAGGREGNEFEFSDLVAREFGTDHHQISVAPERIVDALPEAIARDERADGLPRRGRVLAAVGGGRARAQGRAVRPGRRRGVRRLLLVPAAARGRRATASTPTRGAFFDRDHAGVAALVAPEWALDDGRLARLRRAPGSRARGPSSPVDRALRIDAEVMLVDDPVKRVDNMTMAHGLEARTPFLDHELVELAAACPPELKLADGGKGVLKRAARGVVPDAVIDRPKGYFPVPALSHLEGPVLELVGDALTSDAARSRGLFRHEGRR